VIEEAKLLTEKEALQALHIALNKAGIGGRQERLTPMNGVKGNF